LHAERDESGLTIKVQDDGRGIDYKQVVQAAMTMGLVPKDAQLSAEKCLDLIFEPGFSTSASVNFAAGRGIGLDAVHDSVKAVGGEVQVLSEPGKKTVFEILLPQF
jgi:chemotaxis protein histidine kinase CheA